jgi:hypothetical protein
MEGYEVKRIEDVLDIADIWVTARQLPRASVPATPTLMAWVG